MTGKRSLPRKLRPATGPQLFVLNRAGRIRLVEDEEREPISNAEADEAIRRSMRLAAEPEDGRAAEHLLA